MRIIMEDNTKIFNPLTKRYVAIDGVTGKKLIKQYLAGEITLKDENVLKISPKVKPNPKIKPNLKVTSNVKPPKANPKKKFLKIDEKNAEKEKKVIRKIKNVKLQNSKITDVKIIDKNTYIIHLDDFNNINSINTQGTSKIYNGILNNEKFYIKDVVKSRGSNNRTNMYGIYDIELAINELLASKIYTDIYGIDAIHLFLVVNNANEKYPRYMIASKAIEIDTCEPITTDCRDLLDNKIQGGIEPFLVDCIMANWDVGSRGNVGIITNKNTKKAFRIDVGGSLIFRAMGQKRNFVNTPNEHVNFFVPSNKGHKLFKNLTPVQIHEMFNIITKVDPSIFGILKNKMEKLINDLDIPDSDKKLSNSIINSINTVKKRHDYYINNRKNIETFLLEKTQK